MEEALKEVCRAMVRYADLVAAREGEKAAGPVRTAFQKLLESLDSPATPKKKK